MAFHPVGIAATNSNSMALTNTAVHAAKGKEKPYKLSDARGLHMLVTPQGSKLWRWAYRFEGKQKLMALGAYPDVSLAQAREGADAARKRLATGADPMEQRKAEKIARQFAVENSFSNVARLWWEGWRAARTSHHTGGEGRSVELMLGIQIQRSVHGAHPTVRRLGTMQHVQEMATN